MNVNLPHDVVIDCDPGVDDALALLLAAASPELRLRAVTCVAGNRPLQQTAANACKVLEAAGRRDVPVHAGCARPLAGTEARCNLVHGEDGLGGVALAAVREPEAEHAVEGLARMLAEHEPGTLTLIALGPLTNLALVEILHPGRLARARELLVMGGAACGRGNVTPHAEYNFHADPLAAHTVLGSGAALTLFPLDVTRQVKLSPHWMDSLGALDAPRARLAHAMLRGYRTVELALHDPCPVAFAVAPWLFECVPMQFAVEWRDEAQEGRLHAQPPARQARSATRMAVGAQGAEVFELLRQRLAGTEGTAHRS